MKKLLLGLTLAGLGFACQSSTPSVTETSDPAGTDATSCCASEAECDAAAKAECAELKAECAAAKAECSASKGAEGKTCPYSGEPITDEDAPEIEE